MDVRDLGFGDLSALGPVETWPIGRLFFAASRLSGSVFMRLLETQGVSPGGFLLLRTLTGEDGLPSGEIARRLRVTPATVTSVADTLQRDGHVERKRDDRDRRVVRLHITDSGLAVVQVAQQSIAGDLWDYFDVADEADEPAVRRFLLSLIERFDSISPSSCGESTDHPPEGDRS